MTGQYEADSLLLGCLVAKALAEQNPPPWPCRRGGDLMIAFGVHAGNPAAEYRYGHYDPR